MRRLGFSTPIFLNFNPRHQMGRISKSLQLTVKWGATFKSGGKSASQGENLFQALEKGTK